MNYKNWLKKIVKKYGTELRAIKCPFLKEGKCSIYEKRMNCCRNFPKKIGKNKFCVGKDCKIVKLKVKKTQKNRVKFV
jgi:Fe-S-cluster containining protein